MSVAPCFPSCYLRRPESSTERYGKVFAQAYEVAFESSLVGRHAPGSPPLPGAEPLLRRLDPIRHLVALVRFLRTGGPGVGCRCAVQRLCLAAPPARNPARWASGQPARMR